MLKLVPCLGGPVAYTAGQSHRGAGLDRRSVAQSLNLELIEDVARRIERERHANLDAQDLIMRGRALFNRPFFFGDTRCG